MSEAMNIGTTFLTAPSAATVAASVADEQLDAQEIYSAQKQANQYHEYLAKLGAEVSQGPVKDKLSRLALIVARKNLII